MRWLLLIPAVLLAAVWWSAWLLAVDRVKWRFRAGYITAPDRDRQVLWRWSIAQTGALLILALTIGLLAS